MGVNRITAMLVAAAAVVAVASTPASAAPRLRSSGPEPVRVAAGDAAVAPVAPPTEPATVDTGDPSVVAAREAATTVVEVRLRGGRPDIRTWRASSPAEAEAAVAAATADPAVHAAEVARVVRTARAAATDPVRVDQWGLARLRATEVWARGDASGQVIAVVDTGVDGMHPDLAAVTLAGTDLVRPGGDGRSDPEGHGTHVAGIAAAVADDGFGVSGLAHGARILPVRVLNDRGYGSDAATAQGIVWAVDNGATVVNLSLASSWHSAAVKAALGYAERSGVVVVAAAGNEGSGASPSFPAAHPDVVGVAATIRTDARARFSSTGEWVDIAAPGADILSTAPGGGHVLMDGTSMATPFVAAAAALVRAAHPAASAREVRARLLAAAEDRGVPGWDGQYGHGVVSPLAAVTRPWSPAAAVPFADLAGAPPVAGTTVSWLVGRGITGGCTPERFCPERQVTRAQMAAFVWRYAGRPAPTRRPGFVDVGPRAYYADAVAWLAQAGVTAGCEPGRFCPDRTITRSQMALFLWRLSGSPYAERMTYDDVPPRAAHGAAVSWLGRRQVMGPCRARTFCPGVRVTRAEMADLLWRLYHQR